MTRQRKLFLKFAMVLLIVPVAIRAYEYGPNPRFTGAPGDFGTCLGAGCHAGTLNSANGSVKILLTGSNTYTPGVKQRIQVQITDATKQRYGFQLTARLASDLANGQAGDFSTVDSTVQVICDDGSSKKNGSLCPTKTPVQFAEHAPNGITTTAGTATFSIDWTPPATNVGNVTMYVAGNSGPGGSFTQNNADVYTTNITLAPAAAVGNAPQISAGGVVPIYSTSTSVQPGAWTSIYGSNLSTTTRTWNAATEIINGALPTSLDGVSVTVNGKPAFVYSIQPGQVNVQAPDDTARGPVSVVLTNSAGASNTSTVTLADAAPSLFLFDGKYAAGVIPTANGTYGNYDLLGPAGHFSFTTRAVKRGEVLLLYGVGFGATNPVVTSGVVYSGGAKTTNTVGITIGGVAADVQFAGITATGQYQFNVGIPASTPTGDQLVVATVNGLTTQSGIYVSIQ